MRKKLELKTQVVKKSLTARITGDVDSTNALKLREALMKAAESGPPGVLLDLSGVRKMDSAGIAVLVELQHKLKEEGRQLGMFNTPPSVREMLDVLGVFNIYADLETGLRETQKLRPPRLHDPTKPIDE